MKLVKVKKSGQLRVDMTREELDYFYKLAGRISPSVSGVIAPGFGLREINDDMCVMLDELDMSKSYGVSGYSMRKYGEKH